MIALAWTDWNAWGVAARQTLMESLSLAASQCWRLIALDQAWLR